MCKRSVGWIIPIFLICLLSYTPVHSQDEFLRSESMALVNRYFSCLKNGDTEQLLNMLAGPHKEKYQDMLNRSQYAEFLTKINADMAFEIVEVNVVDEFKTAVDVTIRKQNSSEKLKLIVVRHGQEMKIIGEQPIQ